MITDREIAAVLARVDALLDDYEHGRDKLWTAARSKRAGVAPVAPGADSKPDLPGGALVANPRPAPVKPSPAAAVILPHAMARRVTLAALRDEISF